MRHLARAALALLLASCTQHAAPLAPGLLSTLIFDPSVPRFFDAPFPSDARLTNGAPDFSALPDPVGSPIAKDLVELALERDGFDPQGAIYFRFDRPLPFKALPPRLNSVAFPGIELVDVDAASPERGKRYPLWIRTSTKHDGVRPPHLLQLLPPPGISLRPSTTYAAFVRTDVDGDGITDLGKNAALAAVFSGLGEPQWTRAMTPLIDAAAELDVNLNEVAAATVFTTGDPGAHLVRWMQETLAGPAPKLASKLVATREFDDFVVIEGKVELPIFQEGEPPHLLTKTGALHLEDGRPAALTTVVAPFVLSIPKNAPARIPLYFYVHGTGGRSTQAIDRGYRTPDEGPAPGSGLASWVSPIGYGTSCLAGAYSPDRIGLSALDGYGAYNFFNPRAMRDNFVQMILEQLLFLRLLEELVIDKSLVPGAQGDVRFDTARRIVGGQSLGSFLSGILASSGAFDAAILTGAGGSWIEFGFGPKDPVDLAFIIDQLIAPEGQLLDHHHPFITLFETAVGPADNLNYTPRIFRRPSGLAERTPHVLVIEGQHDLQVPINLQRALVLSLGVDLAGQDVGATSNDQLLPVLSLTEQEQLAMPVQNNLATPRGPRTAVVRRFLEDGLLEGHYVVFQVDDARRNLIEFARDIRDGTAPVVK